MKALDYLTTHNMLKPGMRFRCPAKDGAVRTLVHDSTYGYAMCLDGKIVTNWIHAETLEDISHGFVYPYIPVDEQCTYLEPGDTLHYSKDDERRIIKLADKAFGMLNPDTSTVTMQVATSTIHGISLKDLNNAGFIIWNTVGLTKKGRS